MDGSAFKFPVYCWDKKKRKQWDQKTLLKKNDRVPLLVRPPQTFCTNKIENNNTQINTKCVCKRSLYTECWNFKYQSGGSRGIETPWRKYILTIKLAPQYDLHSSCRMNEGRLRVPSNLVCVILIPLIRPRIQVSGWMELSADGTFCTQITTSAVLHMVLWCEMRPTYTLDDIYIFLNGFVYIKHNTPLKISFIRSVALHHTNVVDYCILSNQIDVNHLPYSLYLLFYVYLFFLISIDGHYFRQISISIRLLYTLIMFN